MTLLCNITEKNKKMVFEGKDYHVSLMWIYMPRSFEMVLPRAHKRRSKYLRLGRKLLYDTPYYIFTEAFELSPDIYIHSGD